jgi:putative ABC transport system substrate-binding protein
MATRAAARASIETPVIACLVLRPSDLGGAPNITGTVLEFPVETELQRLSQILPRVRHIGVVFSPQNNQDRILAASQVAKKLGLTLHLRPIASPREIPAALESLTKEVDALWGLADPVVLTPETAEPILLFSFRNRIPFIGLSQAWAKAGALYALERDYHDIGAQCGELAAKALDGHPPSSLPPAYPRKVVYCVNLKTARHMKISFAPDLIKGAKDAFD